jgi:hypothetical protein
LPPALPLLDYGQYSFISEGDPAMSKTVIGLMDNIGEAQNVVKDLRASGIERDDIGFMANEKTTVPDSAHLNEAEGSRAASGALAGAGTGAAIGGVGGFALALAPLAIPGIGPIVAAGPIAAALAGAGIGAVAGGLIGGLTRLGVPEEEAHYYAEGVRRGGILVTVAADSENDADTAITVMKRHGAVDIDERAAEWKKQGWKGRFEAHTGQAASGAVGDEMKVRKRREKKRAASNQPRYSGPERRVNTAPYGGTDRRRVA